MNKSAVAQKQPFIKQVLPRWLVTVALGMQIAIVTILLMLSVFFTVTFKRNSPQLGSITEQVDYIWDAIGCVRIGNNHTAWHDDLACDVWLFEAPAAMGSCHSFDICGCNADHLVDVIESGDLHIPGFTELDGRSRYSA